MLYFPFVDRNQDGERLKKSCRIPKEVIRTNGWTNNTIAKCIYKKENKYRQNTTQFSGRVSTIDTRRVALLKNPMKNHERVKKNRIVTTI